MARFRVERVAVSKSGLFKQMKFSAISVCLMSVLLSAQNAQSQSISDLKLFSGFIAKLGVGPLSTANYRVVDVIDESIPNGTFKNVDSGWIIEESETNVAFLSDRLLLRYYPKQRAGQSCCIEFRRAELPQSNVRRKFEVEFGNRVERLKSNDLPKVFVDLNRRYRFPPSELMRAIYLASIVGDGTTVDVTHIDPIDFSELLSDLQRINVDVRNIRHDIAQVSWLDDLKAYTMGYLSLVGFEMVSDRSIATGRCLTFFEKLLQHSDTSTREYLLRAPIERVVSDLRDWEKNRESIALHRTLQDSEELQLFELLVACANFPSNDIDSCGFDDDSFVKLRTLVRSQSLREYVKSLEDITIPTRCVELSASSATDPRMVSVGRLVVAIEGGASEQTENAKTR